MMDVHIDMAQIGKAAPGRKADDRGLNFVRVPAMLVLFRDLKQ